VTFVLQLSGPGVSTLISRSLALGYSEHGLRADVHAAGLFVGGGRHALDVGYLGSGVIDFCSTSIWIVGEPRIGNTISFCQNGQRGCHDCLWASLNPGPTEFFGRTIPIGFPLFSVLDFGPFIGTSRCRNVFIPNDPGLAGAVFYFMILSRDPTEGIASFSFGDVFPVPLRL
jgi:hypothetical protein